jgi:hypothetical protein
MLDSGKPIPQLTLDPWLFRKPTEPDQFNASYSADEFNTATNDEGYAVFDWLPDWDENRQLTIWPTTKEYHRQRGSYEYAKGDGTLTMKLTKLMPMRGRVTFADGRPAIAAAVVVRGES